MGSSVFGQLGATHLGHHHISTAASARPEGGQTAVTFPGGMATSIPSLAAPA